MGDRYTMIAFNYLLLAVLVGFTAILVAAILFYLILKADEGNKQIQDVSRLIEEGANSFIRNQYLILASFAIILALLVGFAQFIFGTHALPIALSYILGSFSSMAAGYVGLIVATKANRRTATAAIEGGLNPAFRVAFRAGSVMGLIIAGIALLGLGLIFALWGFLFYYLPPIQLWEILAGFSFGASSVALFARAGGGIFTKTADIAADIVGKVEQNIPEDDPRNPAAIADAVGDNVGDVAGTGADIFDSNIAAILAASIIGSTIDFTFEPLVPFGFLPLLIATLGTLASIVGVFAVRTHDYCEPDCSLNRGTYFATILFAGLVLVVIFFLGFPIVLGIAAVLGLLSGVLIGLISNIYTSDNGLGNYTPIKNMVKSAETSPATLVLSGYSYGLLSTVPSVIGIIIAMVVSFVLGSLTPIPGLIPWEGGVFAVAIAAVGLLATNGLVVSSDAYGPIVDNARGIIEQANATKEAIEATDRLDAVGNTTKAITKGFAIGASAFTVIALFAAFVELAKPYLGGIVIIDLLNPIILAGALIGGALPAGFSAILILGVQRNADKLILEIRRQFREKPEILDGTIKPDYDRCITIATQGAIRELLPATLAAIIVTIFTGIILGLQALAAYIGGAVITGLILAIFMDNAGGAWDNTKKLIESPAYDRNKPKYKEIHDGSVLADMVGDPFKDTAGPSINTLLTVISLTATTFLPLIATANLWLRIIFMTLLP